MITIQLHHILLIIIVYLVWRVVILTISKIIAKVFINKLLEDNDNKDFKSRLKDKINKL